MPRSEDDLNRVVTAVMNRNLTGKKGGLTVAQARGRGGRRHPRDGAASGRGVPCAVPTVTSVWRSPSCSPWRGSSCCRACSEPLPTGAKSMIPRADVLTEGLLPPRWLAAGGAVLCFGKAFIEIEAIPRRLATVSAVGLGPLLCAPPEPEIRRGAHLPRLATCPRGCSSFSLRSVCSLLASWWGDRRG